MATQVQDTCSRKRPVAQDGATWSRRPLWPLGGGLPGRPHCQERDSCPQDPTQAYKAGRQLPAPESSPGVGPPKFRLASELRG